MQLKPVLGPVALTFYGIGVIVGAGVYSVIGAAAGLAQGNLWLSFVVSAVVALLTAISYAEMATAVPAAGAEYVYVRRAWPQADWLAFGIGIVILLGAAAMVATVATSFGGYFRVFANVPVFLSALGLLTICTVFNIWGLRESSWMNILFTSIEVSGLGLVIAAGLFYDGPATPLPDVQTSAVMASAALLFFVYLGFEEIANLAEEVHNPPRDLPLALFWSVGITTALYVMVAIAVVRLAPPSEIAASEAPLATAILTAWPRAGNLLSAIALFATANTVLIGLIASSRLAFALARDHEIPMVFARVLPTRKTPWTAALLAFAMAAPLLAIGDIRLLAELSSFSALVAFIVVNVVLIVLRYRMPDLRRPFRAPLSIGRMPVLPLLAIASMLVLLIHFEMMIWLAGAVALLVSAAAFGVRQWLQKA